MATLFHQFTFHLLEFLFGNDAFFLEVLQLEEFVGYGIVCALLCALYRGLPLRDTRQSQQQEQILPIKI